MFSSQKARRAALRQRILSVSTPTFEDLALAVFQYQAEYNSLYASYLNHLRRNPAHVQSLDEIPFLPISFFKTRSVRTWQEPGGLTFASSGTTGPATSRHTVPDLPLYDAVCQRLFEATYGPLAGFHILALLPSYLERNNSSLVYMVQRFMALSGSAASGFFLNNHAALTARLRELAGPLGGGRRVLLMGVTFGLLDWVEQSPATLDWLGECPGLVVMETGGMKGRRREWLREEVHAELTVRLGVGAIHSEYGMTELLSQAYSVGEGVFRPGATLQVRLRDLNDPFQTYAPGHTAARQTGGVNVIDLANLDSCAFVETQDLGQYVGTEGAFRVIGRFDNADIRGCNLLVSL